MSMHPHPIPAIPEETARVARAILPQACFNACLALLPVGVCGKIGSSGLAENNSPTISLSTILPISRDPAQAPHPQHSSAASDNYSPCIWRRSRPPARVKVRSM